MYHIHLLPAIFGDAILIAYGNDTPRYILIDGGPYYGFADVMAAMKRVAPGLQELELLVVTHVDIDHIDGIVTLLNRDELPFRINEVWFNGYEEIKAAATDDDTLGALQGEYLSMLIKKHGIPQNTSFGGGPVVIKDYNHLPACTLPGGMQITLMSPGTEGMKKLLPAWNKEVAGIGDADAIAERLKKDTRYEEEIEDILGGDSIKDWQDIVITGDTSPANGSSIAFIGTYEGKSCLFSGDATTYYLAKSVDKLLAADDKDRLQLDAWKIGHHGSKASTLDTLMRKIDCKNILVSSNGKRYKHPDKECIAKLLKNNGPGLKLYFNYRTAFNELWDNENWKATYKYDTFFPQTDEAPGISIAL